MKRFALPLAALFLCSVASLAAEAAAVSTKTRIAIAIGLNSVDPREYTDENGKPWDGALQACENDADTMVAIAQKQGYETFSLKTRAATRQAVRDAINAATQRLKPGDTLVLSYSGHGGQVRDTNGDEDDGLDETWCLYDGEIVDDELAVWWSRFQPGVRIVVYSDSCHSGSVIKAFEEEAEAKGKTVVERFRVMPANVAEKLRSMPAHQDLDKNLPSERNSRGATKASVVLLSGCQDDQLSGDGDQNGFFTEQLIKTWDDARFNGGLYDFYQAIRRRMTRKQMPNYNFTGVRDKKFEAERPWKSG
jgi:hypothetical protein